jgi:hypothetical protein
MQILPTKRLYIAKNAVILTVLSLVLKNAAHNQNELITDNDKLKSALIVTLQPTVDIKFLKNFW